MLSGRVLITGGTGSFGQAFVKAALKLPEVQTVCIFSRDEYKQEEMRRNGYISAKLRWFLGDVRDKDRLTRAFRGVDVVVHAAALKQVPALEYNPLEAVQTNVSGAANVIAAALDSGVKKVISLSTDKAVHPVTLYGATKLVMEKLMVQANSYSGKDGPKFSCVRYGNVVGSRGSVVGLFQEQRKSGVLTVTDERMTRFWLTIDQGVNFVLDCLNVMGGGEIFVPKLPSMKVIDLARVLAPESSIEYIGIRMGEKLHEVLVSVDEAERTYDMGSYYWIAPATPWWTMPKVIAATYPMRAAWSLTSESNERWLTGEEMLAMVNGL